MLEAWALLLNTEHPGVPVAAMNPIQHPGLDPEHRAWRVLLGAGGRADFADTHPGSAACPGSNA
ncbi:hypothetical protein QR77_41190 [Streptomyces sp. 150FB]|uniref:hypothetical protein n=1 Tax=Streptomyces sp. 150FB TaxID=1576605 RepID=UPI000589300B|nr:hypothetical protein [Streptomyces sp. 150FB]KIF72716.1 hypothetical protein QR77_41190 [Streptomyces sp. 150FB]